MSQEEDDAARINRLRDMTPRVVLGWGERVERVIGWACAIIAVGSLILALGDAQRSVQISQCINTNLGVRQEASVADSQAQIDFSAALTTYAAVQEGNARALATVLLTPAGPAQTQAIKDFITVLTNNTDALGQFVAAAHLYTATLARDQAFRNTHPVGRC